MSFYCLSKLYSQRAALSSVCLENLFGSNQAKLFRMSSFSLLLRAPERLWRTVNLCDVEPASLCINIHQDGDIGYVLDSVLGERSFVANAVDLDEASLLTVSGVVLLSIIGEIAKPWLTPLGCAKIARFCEE